MAKATGYSIISYGDMITDRPRMDAYAGALRQSVRPGSMVLHMGAGTGIFPERFAAFKDALTYSADLAERYRATPE